MRLIHLNRGQKIDGVIREGVNLILKGDVEGHSATVPNLGEVSSGPLFIV